MERVESAGARARGRREDIEGGGQEGRAIEAGREGEPALLADQGDGGVGRFNEKVQSKTGRLELRQAEQRRSSRTQ